MAEVSVVVCAYNHEKYLEQALDSVAAQSLRPTQLIITDDASTDGSAQLIRAWIRTNWPEAQFLGHHWNVGLPRTLNAVLPLLRGDYVVVMAADDWMTPDRLETQVAAFDRVSTRVGMVYADMVEVDEAGIPTGQRWFDDDRMGPPASGDLFSLMIDRAFMAAPTVMVRRALLLATGPYDETLVAEDYDMSLRLSRRAEWLYIDEAVVNYRVLPTSLSRSSQFLTTYRIGRIRLLRKHLGVTREADLVIARRTAQMAESLYEEGRSARDTASDMWFVLRVDFSWHRLLIWLLSMTRVPGPLTVRVGEAVRRVRRGGFLPRS
jgi:glycosyltransferase involved in cell wall biosynthesis